MDKTGASAVVAHSPDIILATYKSMLKDLHFESHPIDACIDEVKPVPVLYLFTLSWWNSQSELERRDARAAIERPSSAGILVGSPSDLIPMELEQSEACTAWLDTPFSANALRSALRAALNCIVSRMESQQLNLQIQERTHQMREIHQVGIALSTEHNMESLVGLILQTSREMTGADAGTLYLIEADTEQQKVLSFYASQCDSVMLPSVRFSMPLSTRSIAGFVASTGRALRLDDAYRIPSDADYAFNPAKDQEFGYLSRSMLVVPMLNHLSEVIGVIQLINRKRHFQAHLVDKEIIEREVISFTSEDEQLLLSFASQAAVALENKRLLDNIRNLFAGFIRASVKAIEARDPATSGHSDRVARLTVAIARSINQVESGCWRDSHFNDEQLREIEYAGLLHDFGKVGVREHVLVKAKKLYDWKLEAIRSRFRYARKVIEARYSQMRLELVLANGPEAYTARAAEIQQAYNLELAELDQAWQTIIEANEPSILEEENAQMLARIATQTVLTPEGDAMPLVAADELHSLTIRRGTLDDDERREIESHVTHSFNFLIEIPWTRDLQNIPNIAYAHHEKLTGKGYPRGLKGDQIPIQARMMTIADIFDALTAADRPYKLAVPLTRALDILGFEARDGNIDAEMLDLFIQREVYRCVLGPDAAQTRVVV